MRLRANTLLVAVFVSSVVSAAVAVAATEVFAPAYAGAAPAAQAARAPVTLAGVEKLVSKGYNATNRKLGSLQSLIEANAGQLKTLLTTVGNLQSAVNAARTSASQAQSVAGQANGQLATLTPIINATAERLYDTCVLTSSLWQRSFPGIDGNSATSWTATIANETGGSEAAGFDALDRCYSAQASQDGTAVGGMLPSFARPGDAYSVTPPTP